jgi:probable rRNA maturation factor
MFEIKNLTKSNSPIDELLFVRIKEKILGKKYELSLVFVGDKKAQNLNRIYRQKNYIPNVLSFPVDKNTGEIFINLKQIKKEAPKFEMNYQIITKYMFIHGCLHLAGYDHGSEMEKLEKKYLKMF